MLNAFLDQTLTFPVNTPSVILFDTGNLNDAEDLILTSMESHQGTQQVLSR